MKEAEMDECIRLARATLDMLRETEQSLAAAQRELAIAICKMNQLLFNLRGR